METTLPISLLFDTNNLDIPKKKASDNRKNGWPLEMLDIHEKTKILFVESDDELKSPLKSSLQAHYIIFKTAEPLRALAEANDKMPDLIVCDVPTDGVDVVEICRQIKNNGKTSHIPFIILAIKDDLDSKIKAAESGADYYFVKPINSEFLILTINNLFKRQQKLKIKYSQDNFREGSPHTLSPKDQTFADKLIQLIEQNIQAPNLDVEYLCQHLYISRTKLYQKIKNISDLPVGEFIRKIRLYKAAYIMTQEDISINDLIERVGIQSNSYFSKAFKKEFGKSPSHFLSPAKKNKKVKN